MSHHVCPVRSVIVIPGGESSNPAVIPAKAGTQRWVPDFAGMTALPGYPSNDLSRSSQPTSAAGSFRRLWPWQRSAWLQRQVLRGPAIGAVRIPGHVGVADRDGPFRRVPRHPAIRQAVEHKHAVPHAAAGLLAARARSIAPSPGPVLHSRCPAARRCRACLRAVSPARSSMPAVRSDAAPAAAHR